MSPQHLRSGCGTAATYVTTTPKGLGVAQQQRMQCSLHLTRQLQASVTRQASVTTALRSAQHARTGFVGSSPAPYSPAAGSVACLPSTAVTYNPPLLHSHTTVLCHSTCDGRVQHGPYSPCPTSTETDNLPHIHLQNCGDSPTGMQQGAGLHTGTGDHVADHAAASATPTGMQRPPPHRHLHGQVIHTAIHPQARSGCTS